MQPQGLSNHEVGRVLLRVCVCVQLFFHNIVVNRCIICILQTTETVGRGRTLIHTGLTPVSLVLHATTAAPIVPLLSCGLTNEG